jgi:hypothetical protein
MLDLVSRRRRSFSLPEPFNRASLPQRSLSLPVLRFRARLQGTKEPSRSMSYFVDGDHERPLVGFRGLVEAADLPDELQRSSPNLLVSSWRIEVKQRSNVSAHYESLRLANRNKNVQFYNIPYDRVNRVDPDCRRRPSKTTKSLP